MATPKRNIRVADNVWEAGLEKAKEQGTSLSAVLNDFLHDYTGIPRPTEGD